MNGVDWNAVRATYEPRVAGSRTPDEMRRIISLMLGELNASHMGISAPASGPADHARAPRRRFRSPPSTNERPACASRASSPLGPAALGGDQDRATYIDADRRPARIGAAPNLDALLDHTIGKRTALSVAASPTATLARRRSSSPIGSGHGDAAALSPVGGAEARSMSRRRAAAGSATCTCSTCRPGRSSQLHRRPRRRQSRARRRGRRRRATTTAAS